VEMRSKSVYSSYEFGRHVTYRNGQATAFLAWVCDKVFLEMMLMLIYVAVVLLPRWQPVLVSGDGSAFVPLLT
jgi:hypothetical protein